MSRKKLINDIKGANSMKSLPIRPVRTQSRPEVIIQELGSLIDSDHIPQGSKLPAERELAKILNVSRPWLRVEIRAVSLLGILENDEKFIRRTIYDVRRRTRRFSHATDTHSLSGKYCIHECAFKGYFFSSFIDD